MPLRLDEGKRRELLSALIVLTFMSCFLNCQTATTQNVLVDRNLPASQLQNMRGNTQTIDLKKELLSIIQETTKNQPFTPDCVDIVIARMAQGASTETKSSLDSKRKMFEKISIFEYKENNSSYVQIDINTKEVCLPVAYFFEDSISIKRNFEPAPISVHSVIHISSSYKFVENQTSVQFDFDATSQGCLCQVILGPKPINIKKSSL